MILIINKEKFSREQIAQIAKSLADKLEPRGSDDSGVWVDPTGYCALSHRRLSIMDLRSAGHLPMQSCYSNDCISFNREFYHFEEIKRPFKARGIQFRKSSDTEVLLELYRSVEENLFHQIDAMFAFAIYDAS